MPHFETFANTFYNAVSSDKCVGKSHDSIYTKYNLCGRFPPAVVFADSADVPKRKRKQVVMWRNIRYNGKKTSFVSNSARRKGAEK